jgi:hypothetical protein
MKTHFTADDIGKTFATSQQGVTARLIEIDDYFKGEKNIRCLFDINAHSVVIWFYANGTNSTDFTIDFSQPIPSEADLLRKEIEELKASHEADLRTAIDMARKIYGGEYLAPDEIIEKILKR